MLGVGFITLMLGVGFITLLTLAFSSAAVGYVLLLA